MTSKNLVATFTCTECGKVFDKVQALNGHLMSHREVAPCPECGEGFKTAAAQARHRARLHDVPLKSSRTTAARTRRPPPLSEWEADDILETVVSAMFPNGLLPNTALMPLIRWREATRQLIEALQTQT